MKSWTPQTALADIAGICAHSRDSDVGKAVRIVQILDRTFNPKARWYP